MKLHFVSVPDTVFNSLLLRHPDRWKICGSGIPTRVDKLRLGDFAKYPLANLSPACHRWELYIRLVKYLPPLV